MSRVCKVKERSEVAQWGYVESKKNAADVPTRGLSPKKLAKSTLYWHGPEFLTKPVEQWPGTEVLGALPVPQEARAEEAK